MPILNTVVCPWKFLFHSVKTYFTNQWKIMDSSERHYVWLCQCEYFKVIQQFVCVIFKVVSNDFTSSFEVILFWQQERKCTKHRDLKQIHRLHCMQTVLLDMFPYISAKMVNVSFLCCVWAEVLNAVECSKSSNMSAGRLAPIALTNSRKNLVYMASLLFGRSANTQGNIFLLCSSWILYI